jgi:hypothetical protein
MQSIYEFYNSNFEIMLVINPEKTAISAPQTQELIAQLNHHISELGWLAFHTHPEEILFNNSNISGFREIDDAESGGC